MELEARHANIKDPEFNVQFFKSFDIVFNALDNLGIHSPSFTLHLDSVKNADLGEMRDDM